MISKGKYRDTVQVKIKNPSLFVSKEFGEPLKKSALKIEQSLPRQLPKNVNAELLKKTA
jgi:hypothetical protein